jgi:hypothetical protein
MLCIVCVNQGDYQGRGAEYVNKLHGMVARNLSAVEGRFICFTDDDTGLNNGIEVQPLQDRHAKGWWSKLGLFAPGVFKHTDRILYFDLDTVIVGDLDEIAAYDGPFAMLRDFYRSGGFQSSVMAWRGGFGARLYQKWVSSGRPESAAGDQSWIEQHLHEPPVILQDKFPGKFVSYKAHCQPFPPEGSSVVVFHGEPRPHDCGRPWVETMWSEGDMAHFQLYMTNNVSLDEIRQQIRWSKAQNFPRLTSKPAHDRRVAIVGGGPSLADPITLAQLLRARSRGDAIWALNGTYDWLRDRNILPDAHVLIDARLENVQFLQNTRRETTYYVASQCHWVVFDKLKRQERNIVYVDMDVMGDCGSTVGTYALLIAHVEGYRETHLYGYDSSYREDAGHAYAQPLNGTERIVDAHIGDRVFRAAPWMVQQAKDFETIARDIVASGGSITVHGDGLLPYMAHVLAHAPPRAAQIRASEVLRRLPEGSVCGVEVGVFMGEMSAALLARDDLSLIMVDSWEGDGLAYAEESGDWHATLPETKQREFYETAMRAIYFAGNRATVIHARSLQAAMDAPDDVYDFVFIDADHSYLGCVADIHAWYPKLKPGGLLSGHDYDNPDFPEFGVKKAVDEFAARHGYTVELGDNLTWFIRKGEFNG